MLIDKRMIIVGIVMIIAGIAILLYLTEVTPIGKAGMTDDEKNKSATCRTRKF